jgi:hypothetical protein
MQEDGTCGGSRMCGGDGGRRDRHG